MLDKLPKRWFTDIDGEKILLANICRRVKIPDNVMNDDRLFLNYEVADGETARDIADRLYGDDKLFWVVYLANRIHNIYDQWPKSEHEVYELADQEFGNAISDIAYYVNGFGDIEDPTAIAFFDGSLTGTEMINNGSFMFGVAGWTSRNGATLEAQGDGSAILTDVNGTGGSDMYQERELVAGRYRITGEYKSLDVGAWAYVAVERYTTSGGWVSTDYGSPIIDDTDYVQIDDTFEIFETNYYRILMRETTTGANERVQFKDLSLELIEVYAEGEGGYTGGSFRENTIPQGWETTAGTDTSVNGSRLQVTDTGPNDAAVQLQVNLTIPAGDYIFDTNTSTDAGEAWVFIWSSTDGVRLTEGARNNTTNWVNERLTFSIDKPHNIWLTCRESSGQGGGVSAFFRDIQLVRRTYSNGVEVVDLAAKYQLTPVDNLSLALADNDRKRKVRILDPDYIEYFTNAVEDIFNE